MNFFSYAFNLKELLLLFAALQAIFLVFVLVRIPAKNKTPNILLCALLGCLVLILLEYVWLNSLSNRYYYYLAGFSLPGLVVLSPLYCCYANALLQVKLTRRFGYHFLPSLFILLCLLPWFLTNVESKANWINLATSSGLPYFPTYASLVVTLMGTHMLIYFYTTYLLVEKYEAMVREESADVAVLSIHWLTQLSFGFCLFAVLFYLSALDLLVFTSKTNALPSLFVFGIASFIFVLAYFTYRQPDLFALYQPGNLPTSQELGERPKYQNTKLSPELVEEYKQRLVTAMERDKPYLDGELRLGQLAEDLAIPTHHLSQVINVAFAVSFFDFINHYRINHAKALLRQGEASGNILDIALQSGFNSKASFNRVFKREAGVTPSEFIQNPEK